MDFLVTGLKGLGDAGFELLGEFGIDFVGVAGMYRELSSFSLDSLLGEGIGVAWVSVIISFSVLISFFNSSITSLSELTSRSTVYTYLFNFVTSLLALSWKSLVSCISFNAFLWSLTNFLISGHLVDEEIWPGPHFWHFSTQDGEDEGSVCSDEPHRGHLGVLSHSGEFLV